MGFGGAGELKVLKKLTEEYYYLQKAGVTRLARRYFVMNSFDGILTTVGLLSGSYVGGVRDSMLILTIGISAGIAIAMSGGLGVFLTESAERKIDLRKVNETWFKDYEEKKALQKAHKSAAYFLAAVDGLSPFIATLAVLSPFAFYQAAQAYYAAFAIAGVALFLLGAFLGKLSKENALYFGMKMLFAGIAAAAISFIFLGSR